MRELSSPPHNRAIRHHHDGGMRGWKVLAATPLLVVPLAVLGISIADGPEQKASTPAMVLPAAAVEGPTVTMRPEKPRQDDDDPQQDDPAPPTAPAGQEKPSSTQEPQPDPAPDQDCAGHDPQDDDDDDGVEFVHPCPGAVGDDEDDDDDDGDD
jgi:hypothetical protein